MNNIKEMERKTTKIGKKIRKHWLWWVLTNKWTYILGFWVFTLGIVAWFFANYTINFPIKSIEIKYQNIIQERNTKQVKKLIAVPVEEPKEKELYPAGYEEAYDKVWLMESGRGTNKEGLNGYCIAKGEINEIGYAPHDKYCFKDGEEQKSTFITWLTNRINGVKMPHCESINQCLLVYSSSSYGL